MSNPEYPSQGMMFKDFIDKCRAPNEEKTAVMWKRALDDLAQAIALSPFKPFWKTHTDLMPHKEALVYLEEFKKLNKDPLIQIDILQDVHDYCIKIKVEAE